MNESKLEQKSSNMETVDVVVQEQGLAQSRNTSDWFSHCYNQPHIHNPTFTSIIVTEDEKDEYESSLMCSFFQQKQTAVGVLASVVIMPGLSEFIKFSEVDVLIKNNGAFGRCRGENLFNNNGIMDRQRMRENSQGCTYQICFNYSSFGLNDVEKQDARFTVSGLIKSDIDNIKSVDELLERNHVSVSFVRNDEGEDVCYIKDEKGEVSQPETNVKVNDYNLRDTLNIFIFYYEIYEEY